jgi:hypothetical protein
MARLISRFQHIQAFRDTLPRLMEIYAWVSTHGAKGTDIPMDEIFTICAQHSDKRLKAAYDKIQLDR